MPFQSEKQRRYLHANHPEIAKRWERDYANGGISNHFRRRFFEGALGDTQEGQAMSPGTSASGGLRHTPSGNGGGGDHHPPVYTGPTAEEIAAQKAADEARLQAQEDARRNQIYENTMGRRKKNVKTFKDKFLNVIDHPITQTLGAFAFPQSNLKKVLGGINLWRNAPYMYDEKDLILSTDDKTSALDVDENIKLANLDPNVPWNVDSSSLPMDIDIEDLINQKLEKYYEKLDDDIPLSPLEKEDLRNIENLQKDLLKNLDFESKQPTDRTMAAKNGGILDIDASEEIISDDGNDIELTAYNAAFDDPNDLSTGVKSLFQAKDGGTPQLVKKSKDGKRPGYQGPHGDGGWSPGVSHSGAPASTGSDRGPRDDPDRFGPTTTTTTTSTTAKHHPGADTGEEEEAYEIVEGQKVPLSLRGVKGIDPREDPGREDKLRTYTERMNDIQNEIKEKWRKKIDPTLWEQYKSLPTLDFLGILTVIAKDIYDVHQIKKDMAMLEELGLDKGHPSGTDTAYSQLQDYLAKRKLRKKDEEDTKGDGPEVPQVVPVHEEIESYAQSDYYMSPWERMKANQAKRAMLVAKGIIQENPIVDETVTDITMEANKGGLANLFRVKN